MLLRHGWLSGHSRRVPAEQGALILKALEMAIAQNDQPKPHDPDVPAGTPKEPIGAQRADALAEMAEIYLASERTPSSTADRYQVVIHASPDTLLETPTVGASPEKTTDLSLSHIENGPHVPAGTSRRIACDCAVIKITEDHNGEPLSIGRKSRSIPPAIKRALRWRDKGCRFPGCTNTRLIDGHHIKHWADGGETSLDNLVQLCRRHHRLVHEGGFGCERTPDGKLVFEDRTGNELADYFELSSIGHESDPVEWIDSTIPHLDIDADTCVPQTFAGDRIDWHLAVGHLFALERPGQVRR